MPPVLDGLFLSRGPGAIVEHLDNGMPAIIVPIPGAKTATIAIGYKAGGYYETGFGAGSNDGISHFLEHMFFKGTPTMSTKAINEAFTRLGAMLNAFTSHEMTAYFAKVPVRNLEKAISLWGEMLSHVEVNPEEFELERKVVMQEEKIGRDNPLYNTMDKSVSGYFAGTQFAHDIIGSAGSIAAITRDMMLDYIDAYYTPDNAVLVLAGGIDDAKRVLSLANREFSPMGKDRGHHPRVDPWTSLPTSWKGVSKVDLQPASRPLTYVAMTWAMLGDIADTFYPVRLMDSLIDDGKNSLFYKEIVSKGIVATAGMGSSIFPNLACFTLFFVAPPAKAKGVYDLVMDKVLGGATRAEMTADLLDRLKLEHCGKRVLRVEDNAPRALDLIGSHVKLGKLADVKEYIDGIESVDATVLKGTIDKALASIQPYLLVTGEISKEWNELRDRG